MDERFEKQLQFLIEIDKMKSVFRQTILIDRSRREDDASHSWHFAVMAMLLFEHCKDQSVDINRVIKMALVHDLIEIYAGDTFAYDAAGNADKLQREQKSADKLFALLPKDQGEEIRALWGEFDAEQTPDAKYACAIDRLQPFINNIMTEGHTWKRHGVTTAQVYQRMEPIRTAMPDIWAFVTSSVGDFVKTGYLIG
ncbi:MAG TPA: HD domain-containing protein [Oscillospiraceae bacterium]|nr:HD domain-containing protein [Oscillospiraceae bacterium]HPK36489.1 HD domain-containing protein [Oscillospiraceae bacterium]HPR76451.1 HD domain-containing protein [Oscillospiraceae bacterium]